MTTEGRTTDSNYKIITTTTHSTFCYSPLFFLPSLPLTPYQYPHSLPSHFHYFHYSYLLPSFHTNDTSIRAILALKIFVSVRGRGLSFILMWRHDHGRLDGIVRKVSILSMIGEMECKIWELKFYQA